MFSSPSSVNSVHRAELLPLFSPSQSSQGRSAMERLRWQQTCQGKWWDNRQGERSLGSHKFHVWTADFEDATLACYSKIKVTTWIVPTMTRHGPKQHKISKTSNSKPTNSTNPLHRWPRPLSNQSCPHHHLPLEQNVPSTNTGVDPPLWPPVALPDWNCPGTARHKGGRGSTPSAAKELVPTRCVASAIVFCEGFHILEFWNLGCISITNANSSLSKTRKCNTLHLSASRCLNQMTWMNRAKKPRPSLLLRSFQGLQKPLQCHRQGTVIDSRSPYYTKRPHPSTAGCDNARRQSTHPTRKCSQEVHTSWTQLK